MRHRHSILTFATALLVSLPLVASAQSSRVEGLNVPGDYIKDYTAIYGWPSSVTSVGNLIYGEFGTIPALGSTGNFSTLDRGMGAVLDNLWDGRYGTWSIHMREERPAMGQADASGQPGPGFVFDPNTNVNESFDLIWGKKFGTTSLGLRLNRSKGSFKEEFNNVTTELDFDGGTGGNPNFQRNVMGYGAGLGFEMSPTTDAEVSILYESRTWTASQTGGTEFSDDGPAALMFGGRMMWKWKPDVLVVPVVKYYTIDLSEKSTSGTTTTAFENKLKGWQAGVAGNWALNQNDLFVLGLTVAQNKIDQQEDFAGIASTFGLASDTLEATETLMPQIYGGLETHVNSWLSFRFGARKGVFNSYKIKSNGIPDEITIKASPFSFNLGTGVKLGNLQLDAILDTLFPHNPFGELVGGTNISTTNAASSPFTKVTATYAF